MIRSAGCCIERVALVEFFEFFEIFKLFDIFPPIGGDCGSGFFQDDFGNIADLSCVFDGKTELGSKIVEGGQGEWLDESGAVYIDFVSLDMVFDACHRVYFEDIGVDDFGVEEASGGEDAVDFDEVEKEVVVIEVDEDGGGEDFVD
tara:strand:+ start:1707 stop:2144 length:438 start_codon:yes stop_codon:yes gene_type:complete